MVVDFLQLCDVSQEYTVDLFELILSISLRQKLTNLKVKFFSDRASSHKIRVIDVPCIMYVECVCVCVCVCVCDVCECVCICVW